MYEDENGVAEQEAEQELATQEEISQEEFEENPNLLEETDGEIAETAEPQIPNEVWKIARKRAESEAAEKYGKELAQEKSENQRIFEVLKELGYKGSAQEIADQLEAISRKVEPEQVREEREQENLKFAEIEKRHKAELAVIEDLHSIQRINPAIKSLDELGDDFFETRFTVNGKGQLVHTAESAYLELQKKKGIKSKPDISSKEHLIPTGGSAVKGLLAEIPANEIDLYKEMFPNDSPVQLKERYNRVLKRQGE